MDYLVQHWRGGLSLNRSFWINFIVPAALLVAIGPFLFRFILVRDGGTATALTILFIVLFLLLYLWQIVGVLRASDRFALELGDRAWATAAQAGVVLSIVFAVVMVFAAYQNLLAYKQSLQTPGAVLERDYSLQLGTDKTRVYLSGPLQSGITNAFKEFIAQHANVKTVVLESEGGRIYEGRGLSKAIRERGLATHVETGCMSACTTAFIGGSVRTLGVRAKLGFHQYKTYSVQHNIDVDNEQRKDIELFLQRGVNPVFLREAFSTPFEEIWFPTAAELLDAGVVSKPGI